MPTIDSALIISFILFYPGFLFSLSIHEAAHGFVANKLGDPTAKDLGRITLNPVPHMDILGTVILPMMGFFFGGIPAFGHVIPIIGWGVPVPVNPRNLKDWKKDGLWIALAGPLSNFLLAVLLAFAMKFLVQINPTWLDPQLDHKGYLIISSIFQMFILNLSLTFLNLLPIQPLDGGKILYGILPRNIANPIDEFFGKYGFFILLGLLFTGLLEPLVGRPVLFFARLLL